MLDESLSTPCAQEHVSQPLMVTVTGLRQSVGCSGHLIVLLGGEGILRVLQQHVGDLQIAEGQRLEHGRSRPLSFQHVCSRHCASDACPGGLAPRTGWGSSKASPGMPYQACCSKKVFGTASILPIQCDMFQSCLMLILGLGCKRYSHLTFHTKGSSPLHDHGPP